MEQDNHQEFPFPREPWQRLLDGGGGEPPETTDARIRAAARRALRPRSARWWLPASLAASFLLAVMVVRWQYDDRGSPAIVTESDVATAPAEIAPDRAVTSEPRAPVTPQAGLGRETPAPPQVALPVFTPEPEAGDSADRITVTGSRVRESEPEPQRSSERSADEMREEVPATAITAAPSAPESQPKLKAERSRTHSFVTDLPQGAAKPPAPEDWYAEIERLRASGRTEEAERELQRLQEAYPGWLERYLEQAERR